MPIQNDLTSSEYGTLWMTYQQQTMTQRILEYLIQNCDEHNSGKLLKHTHNQISKFIGEIAELFKNYGAVVPVGYTEEDVNVGAPRLYDQYFDILFLRLLLEIGMGLHTLHLNMSFRKDIRNLFTRLTTFSQDTYNACMDYLEAKDIILKSPGMSPSKTVEFAKGKGYMSGLNPLNQKRSLNSVETAHLFFAIESNIFGMYMITGFAQVASEQDIRNFFEEGKNIAKQIIQDFSTILSESDIQPPTTWAGQVTDSRVAPFSDKLMMYCTSLFCSFGLGSNALGTAFSLRTDLPIKIISVAKTVYSYGQKGAKLLAEKGWLEEPPQSHDRHALIN
ncbi:DUF3231 family protein [Pullulanibacillus sp. KACC 23026]|uniref:DUF3231 family protein n=1 Tax=Pullulanibacillus sp. KACC 23026 TaxID=3028315 RepID=UPI0023B1F6F8|nr:DUF3231 family protein [Pullulanibacillus sp. KACC 23026]WEG12145.1 DUF3231 family protein [Pullulanibacillus sp. KACC 23026]